jgi:outer membrane protein TolC
MSTHAKTNLQGTPAANLDARLQQHRQAGREALARMIGTPPPPGTAAPAGHPHPAVPKPSSQSWGNRGGQK